MIILIIKKEITNAKYFLPVPFELHQSSGVRTVSAAGSEIDWKQTYNLEVLARDSRDQQISAPVTIHVTMDVQEEERLIGEVGSEKLTELPETLE